MGADIAIILGSGLNALAQETAPESAISYSEFRELPGASVPGHAGRFVLKQMHGKPIVHAQGRIHLYEGHSTRDASAGVKVLNWAAGCRQHFFSIARCLSRPSQAT